MEQEQWDTLIENSRKTLSKTLLAMEPEKRQVYVEKLLRSLGTSEGMALIDLFLLEDLERYHSQIINAPEEALSKIQTNIQTITTLRERLFQWRPLVDEFRAMMEEEPEFHPAIVSQEQWDKTSTTK